MISTTFIWLTYIFLTLKALNSFFGWANLDLKFLFLFGRLDFLKFYLDLTLNQVKVKVKGQGRTQRLEVCRIPAIFWKKGEDLQKLHLFQSSEGGEGVS